MVRYQRITILGKNQTGKSEFMKQSLRGKNAVIWDPNKEYPGGIRYIPDNMDDLKEYNRFNGMALGRLPLPGGGKIIQRGNKVFVTDETHLILGNRFTDLPTIQDIKIKIKGKKIQVKQPNFIKQMFFRGRHNFYDVAYVGITAGSMSPKILEESHEIIIFHQSGANDIKRLNNVKAGFGEMAKELVEFEWIWYKKWGNSWDYQKQTPLDLKGDPRIKDLFNNP